MRIDVPPEARVKGLVVKLDTLTLGDALLGEEIPVDPGNHAVEASAPARQPWRLTVDVIRSAKMRVAVPVLADTTREPAPAPPAPVPSTASVPAPPPGPADPGRSRRTVGYITGGVGIAVVAVGANFGVSAISRNSDATSAAGCAARICDTRSHADSANDALQSAKTAASVANITIGLGLVAIVSGAVIVLTAPSARTNVALAPALSPSSAGVSLGGTF